MNEVAPGSIAAVDLGSNSFHMIVAETIKGHFKVVDRMREIVRLAAGLGPENKLNDDAINRAIECLQRFGERLRDSVAVDIKKQITRCAKRSFDVIRVSA